MAPAALPFAQVITMVCWFAFSLPGTSFSVAKVTVRLASRTSLRSSLAIHFLRANDLQHELRCAGQPRAQRRLAHDFAVGEAVQNSIL